MALQVPTQQLTYTKNAAGDPSLTVTQVNAGFPGNAALYLDGTGNFSTPAGGGGGGSTAVGDITGLGTGIATFLATPTSANLATAITNETGSGSLVFATSPSLVTPALGVASATTINLVTLTTPATGSTLTIADGKTFTVSKSITLDGTDSTTMTFPSTSATIARTDAGQTFTGTQIIGALTVTTVNGNTFTTGTGVLTIAAAKTFTVNNTLTITSTDGITMTTPSTSFTVARTDAANTFTGTQTITTIGGTPTVTLTNGTGLPAAGVTGTAAVLNGNNFFTANGALSSGAGPGLTANGTWITGGSATTTKPYVLIETTGATSTGWSTNGTGLGVNAATGFTGNLIDLQINGTNEFKVTSAGAVSSAGSITSGVSLIAASGNAIQFSGRSVLTSAADGTLRISASTLSDFTRLQLGVTGATGPALTTTIQTNPILAVTDGTGGKTAVFLPSNFATVSVLPNAATAAFKGCIANVLDALSPVIGSTVTGGGSAFAQVVCNGANWTVTGV